MAKIKARESQNVEYKSSWHDEYLKWICGFANAQGAVMYFGVDDNHEVIGCRLYPRNAACSACFPSSQQEHSQCLLQGWLHRCLGAWL
ncbi:MAG: ATP-binding protein [Bacteroidales bacterium]|nr:ATP-binding protein [Bacteroidales bacterium]